MQGEDRIFKNKKTRCSSSSSGSSGTKTSCPFSLSKNKMTQTKTISLNNATRLTKNITRIKLGPDHEANFPRCLHFCFISRLCRALAFSATSKSKVSQTGKLPKVEHLMTRYKERNRESMTACTTTSPFLRIA